MKTKTSNPPSANNGQAGTETQAYGLVIPLPNGLSAEVCKQSVDNLNQLLADTMTLRDLYKKAHWQVSGPTFYQLHLLFDKHYDEQAELIDEIAERVQKLGGVTIAMAADVAEATKIPRPPKGREEPAAQIQGLLKAHEIILKQAHKFAKQAADSGDDATNDMIVGDVIGKNETQVWFVAEHVIER